MALQRINMGRARLEKGRTEYDALNRLASAKDNRIAAQGGYFESHDLQLRRYGKPDEVHLPEHGADRQRH